MKYKVLLATPGNAKNSDIFIEGTRDSCQYHFLILKSILQIRNVEIGCSNTINKENANVLLSLNIIKDIEKCSIAKKIAIIGEPPIIYPPNKLSKVRENYDIILTWEHSKLLDKRHMFLPLCANIKSLDLSKFKDDFKNREGICLIASNKQLSKASNELYSLRKKAIRYFSKQNRIKFSLYGYGWEKRAFYGLLRPLNKINIAKKVMYTPPSTYKGTCETKRYVLEKYKYSIIFENYSSNEAFITEKIFDCMFSGCIPIYQGSSAITRYIPSNCFIDFRNFTSFDDLRLYLLGMTQDEFNEYMNAILEYHKKFSISAFAGHKWALEVANHIMNLLGMEKIDVSELYTIKYLSEKFM